MMRKPRTFKNTNRRRALVKKVHNKVLLRRKQFTAFELDGEFQEAC